VSGTCTDPGAGACSSTHPNGTCHIGKVCVGGTCTDSGYIPESNTSNKFGCLSNYKSINTNEDIVKSTCTLDPTCVGYYYDANMPLYVATNALPNTCTDSASIVSDNSYNFKFMTKRGGQYIVSISMPSNQYACNLSLDSLSNGDGAEKLCTLDSNCKGYYISSDNTWEAATDTLPENCTNKDTSSLNWHSIRKYKQLSHAKINLTKTKIGFKKQNSKSGNKNGDTQIFSI
jgi:hypothetical protein